MANLSFEPTRGGRSLQAPISFWAFRAQPPLAAQLRRYASEFTPMRILVHLLPVVTTILLLGCAAADIEDTKRMASAAKSCCESIAQLPKPSTAQAEQRISLLPTGMHYDFGFGLSPFTRFTIPNQPRPNVVDLISVPTPSPKFAGGDGTVHYADLRAVFFEASGNRMPNEGVPTEAPAAHHLSMKYVLTRQFVVPTDAAYIVVTTDPGTLGQGGFATYGPSSRAIVVGPATTTLVPGPPVAYAHTFVPYGDAIVAFK